MSNQYEGGGEAYGQKREEVGARTGRKRREGEETQEDTNEKT